MDYVTVVSSLVGTLVGILIPALALAYKLGGMATRQKNQEEHCGAECARQDREHSELFQAKDEHGKAIAVLQTDVKTLDRRVTVLESEV